jgi:predicted RNase H-like HicB family nuclease
VLNFRQAAECQKEALRGWTETMSKSISSKKKHHPTPRETADEHSFTVFFEPAVEGGYVVTCPALPGLVTEGDTLADAKRMAKDSIRTYLESLRKDGEPIPADPKFSAKPVKEKIRVAIPA